MKKLPSILLFEEDSFSAELIVEMLRPHYELLHVDTASAAKRMLGKNTPSLYLLNVGQPGNSGYDICQTIREQPKTTDAPVVFLTETASGDELFKIYEAGADDYLTLSLGAAEFLSRIQHAIAQRIERNKLKADLSNAFSIAMTAMSSASEVGQILQFLRSSFKCEDYLSLSKEILNTLSSFGLDARVQLRGQQLSVSYSNLGFCTVLEEAVFSTMLNQGRLISFSTHTACNYEHITLIVKNMPREDAELYGRMSDNVALLCEAANERVIALDNEIAIVQQKESFARLVDIVNGALVEINQKLIDSIKVALLEIHQLNLTQQEQILTLSGLTPEQESALKAILVVNGLEIKLKNLLHQVDYHVTEASEQDSNDSE